MRCEDIRPLLQDYAARELAPGKRGLVDEHLLECAACRDELALVSAVVSSLDTMPVLEPSPDFAARVISRLPRRRAVSPGPLWALALAPVLAGLAFVFRSQLLAGLFGLLGRYGVDPSALSGLRPVYLPSVSGAQLAVFAAAVVGLGLGLAAGTAAWCWQRYVRR